MTTKALQLYAGPAALRHVQQHGLLPSHIRAIPAAAGGPKGLVLGPLDRFIFGQWLPQSSQAVDLVGASIGAWRMATACTAQPVAKFEQLQRDYIGQDYAVEPGKKRPSASHISEKFGQGIRAFYAAELDGILAHPRYRLHVVTTRGLGPLTADTPLRMASGFGAAYLANLTGRNRMGHWLERVVFSTPGAALPWLADGYATQYLTLSAANFSDAVQASCSIPFVLKPVANIAGAPRGLYWDGGLSDYHLHMDWRGSQIATKNVATNPTNMPTTGQNGVENGVKPVPQAQSAAQVVLYPHFQQAVVPGWLDKALKSRHKSTAFLDNMLLLAPTPEWVASLPRAKLPDRSDFTHFGSDLAARMACWNQGAAMAE
jgi:hypothetical protein